MSVQSNTTETLSLTLLPPLPHVVFSLQSNTLPLTKSPQLPDVLLFLGQSGTALLRVD